MDMSNDNKIDSLSSSYTTVTVKFIPYAHGDVQQYLRSVIATFGKTGERWYYRPSKFQPEDDNCWSLDFKFRDPFDATLFGLKYLR